MKQVSGRLLTQCAIEQYEQVEHLLTAVFQLHTSHDTRLLTSITQWTKSAIRYLTKKNATVLPRIFVH